MVNTVRERIIKTVHRNYGELQRIRVRQRYREGESMSTRVNLALRAQYLEAIVDLASGGYLTRWKQEKNK